MSSIRRQFNRACPAAFGVLGILTCAAPAAAQRCADGVRGGRVALIGGVVAAGEATAIAIRHHDWWPGPTGGFHFMWGHSANAEQDLLIHGAIAYQASQIGALAFDWACVSPTASAWLGAALGLFVELPKEIGDGLHQDQGFAGDDMLSAAIGALIPALHRTVPPMRAINLKANYWPSAEYRNRTGPVPQLESDFAGQRYFLAFDPGQIPGGAGAWPDWLGLAIGHSTDHWASLPPDHEWYAALDVNLRGIPIRAKWWHTFATIVDQIKIPLPGLKLVNGEVTAGLY